MSSTAADSPIINPTAIEEAFIHVVAALIWRDTDPPQFLIAQRPPGKHLQDYWELPGGKLEANESPWRGLQRELEEEIGIRPTLGEPYLQVYYRYPERNILLDTWWVEEFEGEVEARERQALAWIDYRQIDAYRFPPADRPILDAIRRSDKAETTRPL